MLYPFEKCISQDFLCLFCTKIQNKWHMQQQFYSIDEVSKFGLLWEWFFFCVCPTFHLYSLITLDQRCHAATTFHQQPKFWLWSSTKTFPLLTAPNLLLRKCYHTQSSLPWWDSPELHSFCFAGSIPTCTSSFRGDLRRKNYPCYVKSGDHKHFPSNI